MGYLGGSCRQRGRFLWVLLLLLMGKKLVGCFFLEWDEWGKSPSLLESHGGSEGRGVEEKWWWWERRVVGGGGGYSCHIHGTRKFAGRGW